MAVLKVVKKAIKWRLKVVFGLEVPSLETDDDEISKLLETVRTPH